MNNWEYNFFRASLRLNNKPFALVTPDGRGCLSPEQAKILLNDLCQEKLAALQAAVKLHAADLEVIMQGPSTYERGQKIARSLGLLESVLRESESALSASEPKSASTSSTIKTALSPLSVPAAATTHSPKRRRR